MEQQGERPHQWPADAAGAARGALSQIADAVSEVIAVPIMSLRAADSPRLNGEDKAHIMRLAETETHLPPILVDRRTMRVIDGMHRLMAASLQGRETIDVRFFEGSEADVFLRAVTENIAHGLPLSQADRRSAAERIIASHPHMSDRAIGHSAGLAAKTVAAIRRRSSEGLPQSNVRVGRDGRVRPLDSGAARRRAAEMLTEQPSASLRDVARVAGISPATVLDVRKRLERGESPVPEKAAANAARAGAARGGAVARPAGGGLQVAGPHTGPHTGDGTAIPAQAGARFPVRRDPRGGAQADPAAVVEKLLRDPSLRNNEVGRGMLRLLHINAMGMR
ncbi:MAG: ParB N-terminal domain-containing protein, partial [Trebonia sp.]